MIDAKKEIIAFSSNFSISIFNVRKISQSLLELLWKLVRTNGSPFPDTKAFIFTPKDFKKLRETAWKFSNGTDKWGYVGHCWMEHKNHERNSMAYYDIGQNMICIEEPTYFCKGDDIRNFYFHVLLHELNHVDEKINKRFFQPCVSYEELMDRIEKNSKVGD